MKKLYFIVGSQDLYGEECLKQVAEDSRQMVAFLNEKVGDLAEIELLPTVETSEICIQDMRKASNDDDCVGVITWMHTFSPAKMWIKGLQELRKPLLHLHTQANEKLPYDEIDMDFMNLNQSAHGDREYGFIVARMGIPHEVVAGYYKHDDVVAKIRQFASVAKAISYSKSLKVASFGNNMREVAVTDGDRVESQIKYGWECNYYALGDLVDIINQVTEEEIDAKMKEYTDKYTMKTDRIDSVREQAKYEVGLEKFLSTNGIGAFADTFQDLHGLKQLPGIAAQNLMGKGIGFGPEGDYKISALSAVLMKMSEGKEGATGFIEDYTYDLTPGQELELASHMLEVPPAFAATKPEIDVIPLGIGGKELSEENAAQTAKALNIIQPDFIRVHATGIKLESKLGEFVRDGSFTLQSEEEIVIEQKLFLQQLHEMDSYYVNEHIVNLLLEVRGNLRTEKQEMLSTIDRFLTLPPDERLLFTVGRRLNIFFRLDDLKKPKLHQKAGESLQQILSKNPHVDFAALCNYVRQSQI